MNQPHKHTIPVFGATMQYAKLVDMSNKLDDSRKTFIQQVTSTFLCYDQAVDPIIPVAFREVASSQVVPTEAIIDKAKYFLYYAESHPDFILSYILINMVLASHRDTCYLTKPKARIRAGGHFFMSKNAENPANNRAVFTIALIIKNVITSAEDAEIGALYINSWQVISAQTTVE